MGSENKPFWVAHLGDEATLGEIGSKAHNLSILHRMGFNVPPCFFIMTLGSKSAQFDSEESYLEAVDEFSRDLDRVLPSTTGWAVRSSATVEDMPGESHAGRFETLFIFGAAELAGAVKAVWESGSSADIGPDEMGVVVQRRVDADFAGVAFSRDPVLGNDTTVIEGVPGMAARFVDGEVTPWRVRLHSSDISLPENVNMAVIEELDTGVQVLAQNMDMAVDTEWAVLDGEIYWLQVRPLTGAAATEFTIPGSMKSELKGLWVRINHSFAPQATLVASMNPGGYFDGPGWNSRLVNNFHYIQEEKRTGDAIPERDFDRILDEWDSWELKFEPLYHQLLQTDLASLDAAELQQEIARRIELSQAYFTNYSDRRFLEIRDRTERQVSTSVAEVCDDEVSAQAAMGRLLSGLGSLTEEKQRQLRGLAKLLARDRTQDIRETEEWRDFNAAFGSESPTTHLFYLPTLRETPELIMAMLNQMSHSDIRVGEQENWREEAASISSRLSSTAQQEFRAQLARLRRCLLRTENDDYALSGCTMLVRDAYLEAGRRFVNDNLLEDRDDVFHLTGPELFDALSGAMNRVENSLIRDRRSEFERSRRLSPPPMIMNGRAMTPKSTTPETSLSGTPASPGVASGIVLVLNDPFSCVGKQFPPNSIVVAPIVTPSLAYSLIGCAAVVTEIGGLASHGAIVAREMAIPAVVGVSKARAALQTGMSVTVDGSQGKINIIGK